ncbi:DUF3006 domain-containing protein [Candidatus Berkelbacteria bacterium]|nr:DUF3006 domain-containing protein [Candidatus Berkelbacteria bacterium]
MKPKDAKNWVIDRFENGHAILVGNGDELLVPRIQIPEEAKEGDVLSAEFYFQKDERKRRENLAKSLLEEILGKD